LDIVSDVVCPWCYIGKHRLERALELMGPNVALDVRWQPFELNPDLPREGMDRETYCVRKFGSVARAQAIYARVASHAAEYGLPMAVERIARTPNTRAAHRLIELAGEHGCQDAVVDALFEAYFVLGQDVGDSAVLTAIGVRAGVDRDVITHALADADGAARIARATDAAHARGVDGVPAFILNGRLLFAGAQSPETIAAALTRALAKGW
jgi:predicted DsbA family dithiol-disulfide isomerase